MEYWQEQALKLACGSKKRIQCCKDDNTLMISHTLKGIQCYCFRCGFSSFLPHGTQRINDIRRRQQEYLSQQDKGSIKLPDDYSLDVPIHAMEWYLKVGITPELAQSYGIGYTEKLNRVVLPVYDNNELIALQMRGLIKGMKPKYLNPTGPRVSNAVFYSHKKGNHVVMTEDILSAIKVGKYHPACSILGTNLTDGRVNDFKQRGINKVSVWLDGDKAGINGATKALTLLRLYGFDTENIRTDKDPKEYNKEEIMKCLL